MVAQYTVMQDRVELRDAFKALKYMSEATVMVSRAADLKAETEQFLQHPLLTVRSRLAVLTPTYKRKQDAYIAEIEGCVSDSAYVNNVQLYLRPQQFSTAYLC